MISFKGFIVDNGIVTMDANNGYDGGDSLQKTTFLGVAEHIANDFIPEHANGGDVKAIGQLEIEPGIWVRSLDKKQWYGNPLNTSRDQTISMIMWAGFAKQQGMILRNGLKLLKRRGQYQNVYPNWASPGESDYIKKPWWKADWSSPDHWMQYYRALCMCNKAWYALLPIMMPIAYFTDLIILGGAITHVIKGHNDPDFAEDDNHIMALTQCKYSFDTIVSYCARKILLYCRPIAGYTDETRTVRLRDTDTKLNGPASAVLWKHRSATGAPPLGDVWSKHVLNEDW